jgi:hypothetical protein
MHRHGNFRNVLAMKYFELESMIEEPERGAVVPPAWSGFAADEVHWAIQGWAKVAPGFEGWTIIVPADESGAGLAGPCRELLVMPPTPLTDKSAGPKFVLVARPDGMVAICAQDIDGARRELELVSSLSLALHHLCPLSAAQETAADALAAASRKHGAAS